MNGFDNFDNMHPEWQKIVANARPDIQIWHPNGSLDIIELTIPFERNLSETHQRKMDKYSPHVAALTLAHATVRPLSDVRLTCIEFGSRGYIASSVLEIKRHLALDGKPLRQFLIKVAAACFLESLKILKQCDTLEVCPVTDRV